jgi:hypothetical protein
VLLFAVPGCGGVKPVTGGTTGVLHSGNDKLSDIQITVHHVEGVSSKPIGFGVASTDGSFQLVTDGAKGPLHLTPGEYRCTLESVGATVVIPKEYAQADKTPMKITWSASDQKLDLDIPALKPSKY